jgi:hypothetical protein
MKLLVSKLSLVLFLALLGFSCSPTVKVTGSWMNYEIVGKKKFNKIFLFVIAQKMEVRQTIENDLAKACAAEGIATVKSFDVFNPAYFQTEHTDEEIMAKIKETGCDGVFIGTLKDAQSETRYVPGSNYGYYGSFHGYYGAHGGYMYDPGYYVNDKTYYLESNLYDLPAGTIVWSIQSEAYNPSNLATFSREYTSSLIARLKQEVNKK